MQDFRVIAAPARHSIRALGASWYVMTLKRQSWYWLLGLLYGLALMVWSLGAAGAGHGTYAPLWLSSSPLGWLGIPVAFFGLPALWAFVGFLLGRANERRLGLIFLLVIAAHYLSVPLLLNDEMFGGWRYFRKFWEYAPVWLSAGFVIYSVGQAAMWVAFLLARKSQRIGQGW